jgi:hypothetical protein
MIPLSVCIIAKNEEKNIARCLAALKPAGLEIVVVDTGSSDRTREIALQYTDKVYDFAWCDDFAAAKNYAIERAANDWVMVIDSDEFAEELDVEILCRLIRENPRRVGRIRRRNVFVRREQKQENREWLNRIFSRQYFHYEGRIHEQVTALDGTDYETYQAPVTVEHTGYDLTLKERREKAERNRRLLEQELASLADETQRPYFLYQLGKCCYMEEDYAGACDYFSEGLSFDLNPKLEYVIDMVECYGYALLNSGKAEEALAFEGIYEEFGSSADFQFLMGLIYMNNQLFEEAIAEFLKATQQKECRNVGVNSFAAYYNVGVICECLGRKAEAMDYYRKCGSYEPALRQLKALGG